jgi:hypothetical protein
MKMRFRKKVYRDFNIGNNNSSIITEYSHDDWGIVELEHRVEIAGVYGRFSISKRPHWCTEVLVPYDSFDDAVRCILKMEKEKK